MTTSLLLTKRHEGQQQAIMDLIQVLGGSLFIVLCAQIKFPLPFSPVPLSMQTFAVLMIGGMLGKKKGALSVLLYLAQISGGLPFGAGGNANPLTLIGPTGGYFVGFVAQAYLTGWCMENMSQFRSLKAVALLTITPLLLGSAWLSAFVGSENALTMGFYPFLIGDMLKCLAAMTCLAKFRAIQTQ